MPRPATRQETAARNREKLLDAAAKVIGKSGIVGASLQEIATAAGLTKGAVYSQFDSKEDLLVELLDRRFEIGHAQLLELLSGDVPMAERLTQLDTWHRGEKGSGRLWATLELALLSYQLNWRSSTTLAVPLYLPQALMPAGSAIFVLELIAQIHQKLAHFKAPATDEDGPTP